MYIEASLPQRPNQNARIISPVINHVPGTPKCMLFYYHMNGPNVGRISIYGQSSQGTTASLLTLSGDSKDLWQPAAVDLTTMADRFQVKLMSSSLFGQLYVGPK